MSGAPGTGWRAVRTGPGILGLALAGALLAIMLIAAVAGPGPAAQDLATRLSGPGSGHLLGADHLGRDLLARVAEAMRSSIGVAAAAARKAWRHRTALSLSPRARAARTKSCVRASAVETRTTLASSAAGLIASTNAATPTVRKLSSRSCCSGW